LHDPRTDSVTIWSATQVVHWVRREAAAVLKVPEARVRCMDYILPTARDVPRLHLIHQHSPSPLNPLGVKGVGEGGPIGPPAALANAISDALHPFKVEFNRTPITPPHIREAIRQAPRPSQSAFGRTLGG